MNRISSQNPADHPRRVFCTAEDRKEEEPGVRLLIVSFDQHLPNEKLLVFYPPADDSFKAFAQRFANVELNTQTVGGGLGGWNIKPRLLIDLLGSGHDQVVWLDADIIVVGNLATYLDEQPKDALISTEEPWWIGPMGTHLRTVGWGLPVGRDIPATVNACVLAVTAQHIPLLEAWDKMLRSERYADLIKTPILDRPKYGRGAQDVLCALLGSQEFANIPVQLMRAGSDIVQCFGPRGYSVAERLAFWTRPILVHAQTGRPWNHSDNRKGFMASCWRLSVELSPYTYHAERLFTQAELQENHRCRQTLIGRICRIMGLNRPRLTGLPLAAVGAILAFRRKLFSSLDRH